MDHTIDRRRVLAVLGSGAMTALAGCGGDGGATETATDTPAGTATETVASPYRTATAIGGTQRSPDALSAKDAVQYQSEPNEGQQCSGCQFYVEDKNGDGQGACAIVAGSIDPDGWCASYAPYETVTATTAAAALDEPVAVPSDATCPVCEMTPAEFPAWNAQVVHEDGQRAHFDTSGCMAAYVAFPDQFAVTDSTVGSVWVTDFETDDLIDGQTAHYALETDPERVGDPMGTNPAPFADRADAEAYVDAVDYLTTDDIVGFDALDADVARQYRGRLIES